ncbi:hypothetical protein INR49_003258 [Caranx melampygus]|nr:hypothetical protein INR49_003258 [Caranx melampygus]
MLLLLLGEMLQGVGGQSDRSAPEMSGLCPLNSWTMDVVHWCVQVSQCRGGWRGRILQWTHKNPDVVRSIQLLKSTDLGRHSLLYLKEIGNGWFGKVRLSLFIITCCCSALQHPALLQCLAQCTEVTPYLLVMEFCPLGDVKGYLRSCRTAETVTPEPLILQRMACDIASGLLHLHKHNFTHR